MRQASALLFAAVAGAVLALVATAGYAAESAEHWSYSGNTGPAKWDKLSKEFKTCKSGEESKQSPIDIQDAKARKGDLPGLLFNYKAVPLKIVDNGHTIEVIYPPGSFVTIDGKRYELQQFHFHKPAEEKIDGKGYDMGAHLVHRGPDGKLMVIAVLFDAGKENKTIKTLWDHLPKEKDKETTVEGVKIDAVDLLPDDKGYYTYSGSLTTPPCSEQVTWYVLKTPVQMSADQLARFGRVYANNARPIQPFNDRDVMGTR
jgi:carbonic anhydrase